jgi:Yip1 domain.
MTNTPVAVTAEAPPRSLLGRFFGIIISPQATFRSVVAHPRVFGMLALICVGMAVLVGGFLYTKTGQLAWLDAATTSSFRGPATPEQLAAMEKIAPYAWMFGVGQMVVIVPVILLITAGILFAIFNAALGGNSTFKQLFAVVVHSSAISLLGQCFTMPMNYLRGTMSSSTNLAVLLPMVDETSFLGRLLSMVDLFIIWWLVVLAIGLGVLYRRRTQPIAVSLMAVYAVIAVVVAIVRSRMGGA